MSKRVLDIGNCGPDHLAIRGLIETRFDAEVVQAHGLEDAKQQLEDGTFDLILVNRLLDSDGSDGLNVIKQLKLDARCAELPMMMITNYEDHQQRAIEAGAVRGFGKLNLNAKATREQLAGYLDTG